MQGVAKVNDWVQTIFIHKLLEEVSIYGLPSYGLFCIINETNRPQNTTLVLGLCAIKPAIFPKIFFEYAHLLLHHLVDAWNLVKPNMQMVNTFVIIHKCCSLTFSFSVKPAFTRLPPVANTVSLRGFATAHSIATLALTAIIWTKVKQNSAYAYKISKACFIVAWIIWRDWIRAPCNYPRFFIL